MAVSLRRRPKNEPTALEKATAQISDLHTRLLAARATIKELHFELDALAETPNARAQQIGDLRAAIAEAERQHAAQEEYASLIAGHAATDELERLRVNMEELKQQLEAVESAQFKDKKEQAKRGTELRAELDAQQKIVTNLDNRMRATCDTKERLFAEHGTAIQAEVDDLLTSAEQLAIDTKERHQEALRVVAHARADAAQRLEHYPSLKRALASKHRLKDDATSEALAAFCSFLQLLIDKGPAIENAAAGLPAGVISILGEMTMDTAMMRALASGDVTTTRAKLEQCEHLFKVYLGNLAQQ